MAIQTVKTGAAVNDGTGDDARTAFTKINQNFTDNANAASRLVGTAKGNVMEVGAFGLGANIANDTSPDVLNSANSTKFVSTSGSWDGSVYTGVQGRNQGLAINLSGYGGAYAVQIWNHIQSIVPHIRIKNNNVWGNWVAFLTNSNTQTDANGFIKAASPVVKLFADKIELNDEAAQQDITLEKLGVGDYLIKGSTGFAQEGWYIETPKDANGNLLVAVVYEQLENGDISVKTYDYTLNKKGRIVPDLKTPLDIPDARWIDLRLQELPKDDAQPFNTDETVATNAE